MGGGGKKRLPIEKVDLVIQWASRGNDSTHYRAICVIYREHLNPLGTLHQPRENSLVTPIHSIFQIHLCAIRS